MGKTVLLFLLLSAVFYVGISAFRHLTGREKLEYAKTVVYSVMCAALAGTVLAIVVAVF